MTGFSPILSHAVYKRITELMYQTAGLFHLLQSVVSEGMHVLHTKCMIEQVKC